MRLHVPMALALTVVGMGALTGCASRDRGPAQFPLHAHGAAHQDTVSPSPFTYGQGGGYGHGYWASGRGYRPFHQSRYRVPGGYRHAYHRNHGDPLLVHRP